MISHRNIVATAAGVDFLLTHVPFTDIYVAYLPLAHILELAVEVRRDGGLR